MTTTTSRNAELREAVERVLLAGREGVRLVKQLPHPEAIPPAKVAALQGVFIKHARMYRKTILLLCERVGIELDETEW